MPFIPNTPQQHARVKRLLRAAGITQAEIARDLGVTRQCVNAGLNGACVTRVHDHVAKRLGVARADLFPPPQRPGRKPKMRR